MSSKQMTLALDRRVAQAMNSKKLSLTYATSKARVFLFFVMKIDGYVDS